MFFSTMRRGQGKGTVLKWQTGSLPRGCRAAQVAAVTRL